jgi:outer membrane autotransporter protein
MLKKFLPLSLLTLFAVCIFSGSAFAVQNVSTADPTTTAANADGLANGVNFSADGILTLEDNETIAAGGITTATTNTGTVLFKGTTTVNGVVGSSASVAVRGVSGGAANETVTFANNVFATTTTVSSTGTMTFSGNLTGTTVNFDANGNVRLEDGKTLTAAVTTDTNNTGSLSFLGDGSMVGQVGTSALKVSSITGGVAGKQVVFSNDVFATNTYVAQTGTLTFNGDVTSAINFNDNGLVQFADGADITGGITTSTTNTGSVTFKGSSSITSTTAIGTTNSLASVTVEGGTVTLNSGTTYGVRTTYVRTNTATGANGTLKLGQNSTLTGIVRVTDDPGVSGSSAFDVDAYRATVTDNFEVASGATLRTTVTTSGASSTTAGLVNALGTTTISTGSILDVNVQTNYVSNGTVYMVVDGNGTAVGIPGTVTDNSATLSFADSLNGANDLIMTATRANLGTLVAADPNASAVGASLNGFSTGATGDIALVIANIDTLGTTQQVTDAFNQLDPGMDGGINQASFNSTGGSLNTITTRLGNARDGVVNGGGQNGISSGDEFTEAGVWLQGFGAYGDQDNSGGISGYTAGTWGMAGGVDWKSSERTRLGLSFAYSQSNIDSNDDLSGTDVDGYQGTLYGSYEGEPWYVDAMFAFGWNVYDGSRQIAFAGINRQATQDYDGQQYSTKFTFGYPFAIAEQWNLVPIVSLFYSHLSLDGFTETGADSLNLIVADQGYDFLQQGLGAKVEGSIMDDQGYKWVPEFHALWLYDYIGDQASTTSTFAAGGNSFSTNGLDPEQSTLNAGAALTLYTSEAASINFRYDFDYRSDYTGHGGSVTVRYEY